MLNSNVCISWKNNPYSEKTTRNIRVCLVPWFKYSFLYLNPENGGLGLKKFCLAPVLNFLIQILLLYNWYWIKLKWEQLWTVFTWTKLGFGYCSKDQWQFCNYLHKLTGGISVNKHTNLLKKADICNSHLPIYPIYSFAPNPSAIKPHSHKHTTCEICNGHLLLYSKPLCHETPFS